jgi:hypothetical protein
MVEYFIERPSSGYRNKKVKTLKNNLLYSISKE